METIEISVLSYQEGDFWIAQGLQFDITAQARSLPELHQRFAMKLCAELSICLDLGKRPLEGIEPAPEMFWRMFEESKMTVDAETPPLRISDGATIAPHIISRMKVGELRVT